MNRMRLPSFCGIMLGLALAACGPERSAPETAKPQPPQPAAPSPSQNSTDLAGTPSTPDTVEAQLALARLLAAEKKPAEALEEYGKLLQAHPDLLIARLEQARLWQAAGKIQEAGQALTGVNLHQLSDQEALVAVDLEMGQKNFAEVAQLLNAYLERNPNDLKARLRLAEVQSWTKDYDHSLQNYAKILEAKPNDLQVRRHYAQVLQWAGRNPEAIEQYRISLGEKP